MTKSLAASNTIMGNYLSELMTDETDVDTDYKAYAAPVDNKKLEKLLSKVSVTKVESSLTTYKSERQLTSPIENKTELPSSLFLEKELLKEKPLTTHKSESASKAHTKPLQEQKSFQAMFFKVAGLTVAVPLIELGGIHNLTPTNHLLGKPDWFKGVMINRDEKINVVDTARWVMPEKCDDTLINSLNYQYVIMLSNSQWGLTAEHLVDTVTLTQDDVKWVDSPGKRPWLAGLVKARMCALLNVESLIKLLNEGENVYQK